MTAPGELRGRLEWFTRARIVIFAAMLVCTLGSCGFHLAAPTKLPFRTIYIAAPQYSSFAAELKRSIASGSPGKLVDRAEDAEVVLEIYGEGQDAQILSLTAAGRVAEYQLNYRVNYRLHDGANKDWIVPSEIVLKRDMTYDDQAVLAKENEQNLMFQAMREDAVRQMVRRLSYAKPPEPVPSESAS